MTSTGGYDHIGSVPSTHGPRGATNLVTSTGKCDRQTGHDGGPVVRVSIQPVCSGIDAVVMARRRLQLDDSAPRLAVTCQRERVVAAPFRGDEFEAETQERCASSDQRPRFGASKCNTSPR